MHVHTAYAKTIALHIFVFLAQRMPGLSSRI